MKLIINNSERIDKKLVIANSVIEFVGVGEVEGVCIVETLDCKNFGLISGKKDYGVYLPPNSTFNECEVSQHILDLYRESGNVHIVWLSSRSYKLDDLMFCWILAHEFGHVLQNLGSRPKFEAFTNTILNLRRLPNFTRLPPSRMTPLQIDSDLLAYQTTKSIIGDEFVDEYFTSNVIERCPHENYYSFIAQLHRECKNSKLVAQRDWP